MKAHEFLEEAKKQLEERAKLRDKPDGERSVETITIMFNVLTGHRLSEADGWKFLLLLKLVRAENGDYHEDDYTDLSAYGGLLGECEAKEHYRAEQNVKVKKDRTGLDHG